MTPQQQQRANRVVWFEIPVSDLDRATRFYEATLGVKLRRENFGGTPMAIFPYEAPAVGGCLMQTEARKPGWAGSVVYLNADPNLDEVLARVEQNGGMVVAPKTALPPGMGYYADIRDSEGNTVGLHAIS